jgi:uncharacterized membrane protein YphA (DoxX/SURF4 family)
VFSIGILAVNPDWALLTARLAVGIVMLYYGIPKARDIRANTEWFNSIGFRPGALWGTIVLLVENLGGITILLGTYAEVAAALFGIQMLTGTAWKIHTGKKFPDYSYDILLFVLCVVIVTFGAGAYALL